MYEQEVQDGTAVLLSARIVRAVMLKEYGTFVAHAAK